MSLFMKIGHKTKRTNEKGAKYKADHWYNPGSVMYF